ncbi:probable pectinesterase 66 [Setaria viridis]
MRRPNVGVDEHSPTMRSATFTVLADNFVARDISFKVLDFVFGSGQSIYIRGLCAHVQHARLDAGSPGGLVFKGRAVTGTGRIYLGRAWNGYATVVFYGTRMDDVVVPQGWQAWNAGNDVSQVTFAEVGCTGPGSDMSRREGWEKRLSDEEVKRFVDMKFIDDGWLSTQP